MAEKRWKAQERRVARLLGARRNPAAGQSGNRGHEQVPDVENEVLAIEVKDRRTLPQWLLEAMAEAKQKAPKGKLPLVALTSPEGPQALVVLDIKDYREWYVGVPRRERQ